MRQAPEPPKSRNQNRIDMANSIGPETFICFYGEPPAYQETIERLAFPGEDGARYRKLGKASGPFMLQSCVDVLDIPAGRDKLADYAALVGAAEQHLVWRGRDFDDENLKVVVMAVKQVQLKVAGAICGGLASGSTAILRVDWSLEFRKV